MGASRGDLLVMLIVKGALQQSRRETVACCGWRREAQSGCVRLGTNSLPEHWWEVWEKLMQLEKASPRV